MFLSRFFISALGCIWPFLSTVITAVLISVFILYFTSGCSAISSRDAGANTQISVPARQRILIVPPKVMGECQTLTPLDSGQGDSVVQWATINYGKHNLCAFRKDLSDDFLRAASMTGAGVELLEDMENGHTQQP